MSAAEPAPTHQCPRKGCTQRVPHNRLMCGGCWFSLPKAIRTVVWRTWQGGRGEGSDAHIQAMQMAIAALPPKGEPKQAVYH